MRIARLGALALIALAHCAVAALADDADAEAEKIKLPGRIYIAVPRSTQSGVPDDVIHGLLAVDPNARTCMTIAEDAVTSARVAPDGRRFAHAKPDQEALNFTVLICDVDGDREPVKVFDYSAALCWTTGGRELIVSCPVGVGNPDSNGSWKITSDGSRREKLPIAATEAIWDVSADGQWLLTSSSASEGEQGLGLSGNRHRALYVMRVDGRDRTLLVPADEAPQRRTAVRRATAGGPRFSPDGGEVAYIRMASERSGGVMTRHESRLWLVGRDGTDRRMIFEGDDEKGYPTAVAWSPDGRFLALGLARPRGKDSREGADNRLLIVDRQGKTVREIFLPFPSIMAVVDWR